MRDEVMGRLARFIKELGGSVKAYKFEEVGEEIQDDVDRITFDMAMECPIWQVIHDIDPKREIDVRMTYADLAEIYRRMA